MNEIETKADFLEFRVVSLLIFFSVLYIALIARAFQLQVLSSDILKERYNQQQANVLESSRSIKTCSTVLIN